MRLICTITLLVFFNSIFCQYLVPYRSGNKWGYSNTNGDIVIKPKYRTVNFFYSNTKVNGIAPVKRLKKYFYINKKGKKCFKEKFDKARGFNTVQQAYVTNNEETYCINLQGKKTRCQGYCDGSIDLKSYFHKYSKNGKIGLTIYDSQIRPKNISIDENKKTPPIWDKFIENQNGLAAVLKDGKWGIIDTKLKLISEYKYDTIITRDNERTNGDFKVKINDNWGLLDRKGRTILEPIYFKTAYSRGSLIRVWTSNDYWYYIHKNGTEYHDKRRITKK